MKLKLKFCVIAMGVMFASCSTSNGYNYSKHYKKAKRQNVANKLLNLDNCKNNNHAYNK